MIINLEEIRNTVNDGNLRELSRQTDIPLRTLEDWRYNKSKALNQMEERLTKIQKYINKENGKMKKYSVLLDRLDVDGNPEDNEILLETNDLEEARAVYEKEIEEIQFYEHKKSGVSLMENINEDESETLNFFAYMNKDNQERN